MQERLTVIQVHLVFYATFLRHSSTECSVMPVEIGVKYISPDSPEPKGPLLWIVLFRSPHMFSVWFSHGIGIATTISILWSLNHLCVELDACIASRPCWKIQI